MSEEHLTHDVVNIVAEKKKKLFAQVETLTQKLAKYVDNIGITKKQLDVETEQMIEKLKDRKQEAAAELDVMTSDAIDNIATLEDIKEKTAKCTDANQVAEKMEFVEQLNYLCHDKEQLVKCLFFKLVEDQMTPDASLINKVQTHKYIKQVLHNIRTDADDLHDMQMLSDGSLLVAVWWTRIKNQFGTSEVVREKTCLVQHSLQTGETLFCQESYAPICNIAHVELAGIPCVAVGYKHEAGFRIGYSRCINFHHNPKVYKTLFSYENRSSRTDFDPRYLYSPSKSWLVWGCYDNTMLVCDSSPPTEGIWESKNRLSFPSVDDSVHVSDNKKEYLLTSERDMGVAMYTRDFHRQEWRVTGKPFKLEKEIDVQSVTTDGRGNIYLYDSANKCILLFHTDGTYRDVLIREGEHDLGSIRKIRWCRKSSALVVAHRVDDKMQITAFRLAF